jgi:hypothetical protein
MARLKLGRYPNFLAVTLAALPSMSLFPKAPFGSILPIYLVQLPLARLKLVRYPRSLAATIAALPSMSLIPFAPFIMRSFVARHAG